MKPLQLIVGVPVILANTAAGLIHKSTVITSLLSLEKSPYRWESKGRPLDRHLGKQKGQTLVDLIQSRPNRFTDSSYKKYMNQRNPN